MVTGRRAFHGDSTASTLAAVLRHEPDSPTRLTPQVPRELERIVQRCLRKDPNRRFQHMSDVKVELEDVREESESGTPAVQPTARRRRRTWMYAAGFIALLGIAAAIWWWLQESEPPPPPIKPVGSPNYLQLTKGGTEEKYAKWSPDGQWIAFQRQDNTGEHRFLMSPIGGNERNYTMGVA